MSSVPLWLDKLFLNRTTETQRAQREKFNYNFKKKGNSRKTRITLFKSLGKTKQKQPFSHRYYQGFLVIPQRQQFPFQSAFEQFHLKPGGY